MRSPLNTLTRVVNRSPVPYVGRTNLQIPFRTGTGPEAQMRAMGSNGTLFAIVDKLASGTAEVDWHLWRKAASGKPEDRTEVTTHPALDLLDHPNDFYTRQELVEASQQHFELVGEMWWVIGRDRRASIPLELWPVRPDRMQPVPSADKFLAGYVYTGPDGEKVPLDLDDVIFIRRPNPLDPYRGIGAVQAAILDLDASRYAKEWNRNFFVNSAEPGGIIQTERRLSDAEFDELRERWAEQHRGVANAHRVAILEAGQWVERKITQRDMQFVELRNVTREEIREAFGMPKPMLGAVDDVNRANAEAGEYVFARWLIVPRLNRLKGALNNDLLGLYDATDTLEFDFDSPVPEDQAQDDATLAAKANAAKTLVDAGYDPAGVIEVVDLPELEHTGITPASLPPGPGGMPGVAPALPGPGRRATPAEPAEPAAARYRASIEAPPSQPVRVRADWEDRLDQLVGDWAEVSAAQRAELADQIETIVDNGTPEALAGLACDSLGGAALLTATMFDQADAAGRRVAQEAAAQGVAISPVTPVDPDQNPANRARNVTPRTVLYVAGLAADLIAAASVSAKFLAAGLASAAAREAMRIWHPGAKGADVAAAVTDSLEQLSDSSLRRTLGGQVWAAENEGRFATLEQAETDGSGAARYTATEIGDANTCEPCADNDGHEYDTLAEAQADYPFGGFVDCEGRDNCRGTVNPEWD